MSAQCNMFELQENFIKDRIDIVEKNFSEVCNQLSNYVLKLANLRDVGDDIVQSVMNYASKENLNQTLKASLLHFSNVFSGIQDYREAQIHRLEAKVVQELSSYGPICRQAREGIKHSVTVRTNELNKKRQLEKLKRKNPTNWQKISQAENEYHKASTETIKSSRTLENEIDVFEKNKLEDIKRIFLEFINIEMLFHSKALELYTDAYNAVLEIKVEEDLEIFRNCLRTPSNRSRLEMVRHTLCSENFEESPLPPLNNYRKSLSRYEDAPNHLLNKERPSTSFSKRTSSSDSELPLRVTSNRAVDDYEDDLSENEPQMHG